MFRIRTLTVAVVSIVITLANGAAQIGSEWVEATTDSGFTPRFDHTSVIYDNKMWVIGGSVANDVWSSTDGINWTEATASAPFGDRAGHSSVVYDDGAGEKMWVIGGLEWTGSWVEKNDVWYSANGVDWDLATGNAEFSPRSEHKSVVFGNKMWVIAGFIGIPGTNDVWYSTDGVSWTEATTAAAFSARGHHTSVVYDDGTGEKMWVIAGQDRTIPDNLEDIWYSSDGVTWIEATSNAAFGKRGGTEGCIFDGKMWVIGGWDGANLNDVWYSTNGANWTEATATAGFSERTEISTVAYNSRMWVLGGQGAVLMNDVWYSPPDPTPTESPTSTHSSTITKTLTVSPTPTLTPTATPTITFSQTVSPTYTITPTLTSSATLTISPTLTPTVPSVTPTRTVTPTFTFTMTPEPEKIVVYPNPFNPNKAVGGTLKFKGLPDGTKVSIYTVSGELVIELRGDNGAAYWDGRNESGTMVAIGLYVYVIEKGKETLKRGKIVVVR